MATECRQDASDFGTLEGAGVGAFDGGVIGSDALLLLRATDKAAALVDRFADPVRDGPYCVPIAHTVAPLTVAEVFLYPPHVADGVEKNSSRGGGARSVAAGARTVRFRGVTGQRVFAITLSGQLRIDTRRKMGRPRRRAYHKIRRDTGAMEAPFVTLIPAARATWRSRSSARERWK
jgi:hypothetical protein